MNWDINKQRHDVVPCMVHVIFFAAGFRYCWLLVSPYHDHPNGNMGVSVGFVLKRDAPMLPNPLVNWLVVWNMIFLIFHSVGNVIIPTD